MDAKLSILTCARIALMVFLIAYALFEVPSNYFLKKLRPSVCHENPALEIRDL